MDWIESTIKLVFWVPYALIWLAIYIITGLRKGRKIALRVGTITLPIPILVMLIVYGKGDLLNKTFAAITIGVCVLLNAVIWTVILTCLSGMIQSHDVLVDRKPLNFVETRWSKFNPLFLALGLLSLVITGSDIWSALTGSLQTIQEWLLLFLQLSTSMALILKAFLRFQIRKNGIVTNWGRFLRWTSIVKYETTEHSDSVMLDVRRSLVGNRTVTINVPPEHKALLEEYLAQYVSDIA